MKNEHAAELLGRRIRSLRRSKSLTQEELGETCGINYKHLGAIERGEENPSLLILEKIANGLDVEISELFRFHHEETDPVKLKRMAIDLVNTMGNDKVEKLQLILKIINVLK